MPRLIALIVAVASLTAAAQESIATNVPVPVRSGSVQPFVGFSAGVGAITTKHPLLNGLFAAPAFALNVGVQFRKMWIFSGEVGSVSQFLTRNPDGSGVYKASAFAGCTSCESEAGAQLYSGVATFPSIGPRVDFSPMGETSPFVSVAGGFVFTQGALGADNGGYVTGRVGFRWRFVPRIEATAEAGYQAEWFAISTMRNAFGNLMLRAYF